MAHADAFLEEMLRVSADLDRLIADRQHAGRLSQRMHDDHVDQASELGTRLVRAGRGSGRPVHPPIGRVASASIAGVAFAW